MTQRKNASQRYSISGAKLPDLDAGLIPAFFFGSQNTVTKIFNIKKEARFYYLEV